MAPFSKVEEGRRMGLFGWKKRPKEKTIVCSAVVVAAGSSTRMGSDKLLLPLGGVPVIVHTLQTLQTSPSVDEIILVTREDLLVPMSHLCQEYGLVKVVKVIRGGKTRTESVRLGTLEAHRQAQVIAIHDGARPFVPEDVVEAAVRQALATGAAAPAIPVKDTIKVASDGVVDTTPDRSCLFAVQTPQVFEASLIRAALQKALDDGAELTDDCAAVERLGMKVVLTPGHERNIKLTTPQDMLLAQALLEGSAVS
jgi:2-C-methyl-D-erythritol 4-phosphate cytidylyltransferase